MFHTHHLPSGGIRRRHLAIAAGGLTLAGAVLAVLAVLAVPAGAAARSATVHLQPAITSVSFQGIEGSGQASPTITVTGVNFGSSAPAGTSDDTTSCGVYSANGDVYINHLFFTANQNFEAGFDNSNGANCIGIIVQSWSSTKVVLQFGNSYGTFAHWYLSNGDGYAISIKSALWGFKVSGLT